MRRNRRAKYSIDGAVYALRKPIADCFNRPRPSLKLATRYAQTAESYLGIVLSASARLGARRVVDTV